MKILIVTKNWLGDILFQIPAIEMIRDRYPEAEVVCVSPARCREILESHPAVDRVLIFDEKNEHRSFLSKLRFAGALRKEKWNRGYLFHRSKTRAFLLWLGGVKERIGYGKGRRFFLTRAIEEPATPVHHVDYFTGLLAKAGFPAPAHPVYHFYIPDQDRKIMERVLQEHHLQAFVCFHLGANWEPKQWPPEHFSKLADDIFKKWGMPVVLTGGPGDQSLADTVLETVRHARVISFVGKTSLGQLGAVYEKSAFIVSGDSGPMHIASAVGARVVALFGPTNPALTGPRGTGETMVIQYVPPGYRSPWYGKKLPGDGWLSHIKPEEVMREIAERGWGHRPPFLPKTFGPGVLIQKKKPLSVKRILLVTLSNIGDVILTTPVIRALAAQFPQAELTVVCGPRAKGILEGSRFIRRVVIYDKKAGLFGQWKFLCEIRKTAYDLVVDLRHTAIPYLVKAKKRSPLIRRLRKISFRERHLEVLEKMGLECLPSAHFDFFNHRDEERILEKLRQKGVLREKGWILIAPAAASELKTWPLDKFKEVIRQLLQSTSKEILLVGDKREGLMVQPLLELDPSRIYNFAGETTLRELAAVVSRAALLVANDSAVMHLGFELGRPTVALFGPTHHAKYGHQGPQFKMVREPVSCSPCEKPVCDFQSRSCLDDLSPEKVFQACQEFLDAD